MIPALGSKKQENLCEFKASQVYRVSQSYTKKPCLQKGGGEVAKGLLKPLYNIAYRL